MWHIHITDKNDYPTDPNEEKLYIVKHREVDGIYYDIATYRLSTQDFFGNEGQMICWVEAWKELELDD